MERRRGPRRILHTSSRDSAVGHEGPCKSQDTDGGGDGTRARATTAPTSNQGITKMDERG